MVLDENHRSFEEAWRRVYREHEEFHLWMGNQRGGGN